MDYLQYVDADSLLHRLDPRTKFLFFLVMAVLTSVIKSGVALLFLFAFFIAMWCTCRIQKYILVLAGKLKVLLAFIFLLWLILGLFETPVVQGGPVFFETVMPFFNGQGISICFDWYDLYKGAVYALRIFLMISSFYTVLLTTNFSEIILGASEVEDFLCACIRYRPDFPDHTYDYYGAECYYGGSELQRA